MLTIKEIKDAKKRADKIAPQMFIVISPIPGMETTADQLCGMLNYITSIDHEDESQPKFLREMAKKFHDQVSKCANKAITELATGNRGGELN